MKLYDAMVLQESSGCKKVQGASGEYGCAQYIPGTWRDISIEMTQEVLKQTPINEKYVSVLKVQQLLDRGFDEKEIAMIWNTSLGGVEEPLIRKGTKVINGKLVKYDSVEHGLKVVKALTAYAQ